MSFARSPLPTLVTDSRDKPETSRTMNGLPNHHPVFNNGARAIPVAAGQDMDYPAGHSALLGSRYGAAAGMSDLLLLQRLRSQQERLAAGDNTMSPAAVFPRRDEEELTRLRDGHNRMMEAELVSSAMRDRIMAQQLAQKAEDDRFRTDSIERLLALQEQQRQQRELPQGHHQQQAAELIDQAVGQVPFIGYAQQQQQQHLSRVQTVQLQESLLRKLLLEEEAVKRHYQQQQIQSPSLNGQQHQSMMGLLANRSVSTAAASRGGVGGDVDGAAANELDHLSRLKSFPQLSDEDLIRRAAELHSAQNAALRENLERNQRAVAAAHNQKLMETHYNLRILQPDGLPSAMAEVAKRDGKDNQQIYLDNLDQSLAHNINQERAMSSQAQPSSFHPQPNSRNNHLRYFNNGIEVDMHGNPLPSRNSALENNITSTNASTNNSSHIDSAMISQFLTGVVSRVPEIAPAIATLLPDDGGAVLLNREFPNLVNSILGILVSVQERVARTASDDIELDLLMRVTNCIKAIKSYRIDNMSNCGVPITVPPAAGNPTGKGSSPTLRPEGMMMMMRWDPLSKSSHPVGQILQPGNQMKFAPNSASWPSVVSLHEQAVLVHKQGGAFQTSHLTESVEASSDTIKLEHTSPDDDDIPIMAMYKATKRAAKRAKKAEKWKRRPKLVHKVNTVSSTGIPHKKFGHHTLQTGGFDANQRMADEILPTRHISLSPGDLDSRRETVEKNPSALQTCDEENDVHDDDHENDEVEKCGDKLGPHGDTLDRLFGDEKTDKATNSSSKVDGVKLAPKPSAVFDSLVISPEESDDNASTREVSEGSKRDGTDVHYDAASVLLGLMKK